MCATMPSTFALAGKNIFNCVTYLPVRLLETTNASSHVACSEVPHPVLQDWLAQPEKGLEAGHFALLDLLKVRVSNGKGGLAPCLQEEAVRN